MLCKRARLSLTFLLYPPVVCLISDARGSLLDDVHLVNALQESKTISEEVTQQLRVAEDTAQKIDAAREGNMLNDHTYPAC